MLKNVTLDTSLDDARALYAERRPGSLKAHDDATRVMPGGNTRTVLYHGPFPLRAASGDGAYLKDVDGHRYLNLLGEYTAGLFGHSHPDILSAIRKALDTGVNLSAHNEAEAKFASAVTRRFPAMERVRFTNSGTEANLMAVSTARHVTGRDKVMVFNGGYHGGVLYFGGGGIPINAPFDYVIGTYNDAEHSHALIEQHASELACVLVEPMIGSSGCIPGDPDFLAMLRKATREAGALLIFDEVMTSRFGSGGAGDLLGITPDLMTLGKWIAGGMSFGAFGGRADLMATYDPTQTGAMPHAGTFNNNTLSMHAGIAALGHVFTDQEAIALHNRGEVLLTRLNTLFKEHGVALTASGKGSLINLHPVAGPVSRISDIERADDRIKELLFLDLLEAGFYIARRGFIALSIVVTDAELDGFIDALGDILDVRASILPQRGT